jgi:hypothetical protein
VLTGRQAALLLGTTAYVLMKEAASGRIKAVNVAGWALCFDAESVKRRAAELKRPLTRGRSRPATVA